MATIDYEQKIKDYMNSSEVDTLYKSMLINLFPELKESEDERIRKWLICTLKSLNNSPVQIDGAYEMMLPAIAWLEKQGEQKPAIEMKSAEESLGIDSNTYNKIVDECIYGEQKPIAWSEEDEKIINKLIAVVELYYGIGDDLDKQRCLSWLNSIKDRYTWKPTKEQLTELRCVISGCSYDIEPLVELEKELKAL